ncbi:hypothetical protein DIPPA_21578 [Diplonema papillatum]|nr:hypothetical protein DIPPA_21578 [Diplonema papillatum]
MPHFEHAPQVKLEPQDRIAVAVGDSFKRPSATALLASVPDEVADDAVDVEDVVITGDTFDAVLTRSNSVQTTEVSGTLEPAQARGCGDMATPMTQCVLIYDTENHTFVLELVDKQCTVSTKRRKVG